MDESTVSGAQHNGRVVRDRDGVEPAAQTRVAVVSGGSRGLGLEVVRMLADRGMRVVLTSRQVASGCAAVGLLGDAAERVAVRGLDITDMVSVTELVSWLRARLGRCDVLVNNAAVLIDDDRDASTVDLALVWRTLETNLFGTWRLTQAIAPLMRAAGYGRIVNVSSGLGSLAGMRRGLAGYRVSKTAVNAMTRMLADELAADRRKAAMSQALLMSVRNGPGISALQRTLGA